MVKFVFGLILILIASEASQSLAAEKTAMLDKDYIIGPGDVLEISVWKEEALSKELTVLPDGKLTFPLIGNLVAAGHSANEIKKELTTKLTRFISDPIVSVGVRQVNSFIIYVVGKVNNPNNFLLNARVNVLQALAMAGGLNQYAEKNQVRIFREQSNETIVFYFDYDKVSQGKNLEQNILLQRGDVIVVR